MRRRLTIVSVLLLAGAIANLALAWAVVLWGKATFFGDVAITERERRWWRDEAPGPLVGDVARVDAWRGFGYRGALMRSASPQPPGTVLRMRAGWPAPAVQAQHWRSWALDIDRTRGVVRLPWPTRRGGLPVQPLWPGLIANTIFWSVALCTPAVPFLLRRWLRIRRGLCTRCAYPMGKSPVCSECGVALQARSG